MPPLAWASDLHLDLVESTDAIERLVDEWNASAASAVICTGDVAEGASLLPILDRIDRRIAKPFYFVLGNHDFYDGVIADVRRTVADFARASRHLRYLTAEGSPILLFSGSVLVGEDGWADGRLGDFEGSQVSLRDFDRIDRLTGLSPAARKAEVERLGRESADRLRPKLERAFDLASHVLLATHVPPLREACWYRGRIADDEWAPHFVCFSIGEMVLEFAQRRPDRRVEILCGHCHHAGVCRPLPNVAALTSSAGYAELGRTRLLPTA